MIRIKQYDISLKEQRNNKVSVKTTTEVKENEKSIDDKSSKLKEMVDKIKSLSKSNPEEAKKLLKTLKLANKDNVISEKTVKELEDLFIKDEETKNDGTAIRSCEEFSSIETRGLVDDTRMVLYGYVNQVGKLSEQIRDKKGRVFREKILPGAFKRAIDRAKENNNPIKLLFRHNSKDLLASTVNSSLNLEEDNIGLRFNAEIVNTTLGKDVYNYVKTGLISNMSFGFRNAIDEWSIENGQNIRIIKDFDLTEISILDNPAYKDSIVKA
ncbi:MAG: HK97 family phage prohead protease [Clostridium baratii]